MAISEDRTLFGCQFSVDKNGCVSKWSLSPESPHKFMNDIIFLVNFIIPQKSTANHFFCQFEHCEPVRLPDSGLNSHFIKWPVIYHTVTAISQNGRLRLD